MSAQELSIMNIQPIMNIGCLGSVSDGKSTLVKMLTGIETQKDSREKVRNITINQGYGNMKIYKNLQTGNYITTDSNNITYDDCELVHHISFVDCPGHQELIKVTLGALELMNGAIVIVAVDQPLSSKPQLAQHLAAAKLGSIDKIIVCMNKIDLVDKETLYKRKEELDVMLQKYNIVPHIIIPTCFNKKIGMNHLVNAIMELFNPIQYIDMIKADSPLFNISRTFDINKPGTIWNNMLGGVVGGSLVCGKLSVGQEIEIRPGILSKNKQGKIISQPITTTITSIKTDTMELKEALPGGLIGIGTDIDPFYCQKNALVGHMVGLPGHMPNTFNEIVIQINLLDMFGFKWEPKVRDMVTLKIGTYTCEGRLMEINNKKSPILCKFDITKPVCIRNNENIIVCREFEKIIRVVAQAKLSYHDNQ
jgi:translation initiation factor 2 subunit 3